MPGGNAALSGLHAPSAEDTAELAGHFSQLRLSPTPLFS